MTRTFRYLTLFLALLVACGDGRLSPQGGTITSVQPTTGGGLTGGGIGGAVTLGLLTSCSTNQVLKWNGSAWVCGIGGISNSAGLHIIPVSDGTNLIASSASDDGVAFAINTSKFTVTEANGNTAVAGTLTADTGLRVIDIAGTGLLQTANSVALNINAGVTQTCGAGTAVTVLSSTGITTCAAFGSSSLTNGAGNNVFPLSNGTNLVTSPLSYDGSTWILTAKGLWGGWSTITGIALAGGAPITSVTATDIGFDLGMDSATGNVNWRSKLATGGHILGYVGAGTSAGNTNNWLSVDGVGSVILNVTAGTTTIKGSTNIANSAAVNDAASGTDALIIHHTPSSQVLSEASINADHATSYNTTSAALTAYVVKAQNAASRASGTNTLTDVSIYGSSTGTTGVANVGGEFNASGGAVSNTALLTDNGDVNLAAVSGNVTIGASTSQTLTVNSLATLNGATTVAGAVIVSGSISPTALIGTQQNDYAPTGAATASTIRQDASAATTITGLSTSQVNGREITWSNISTTSAEVLANDDGVTSTAANRFLFDNGASCVVPKGSSLTLRYDGTSSRWRNKTPCPVPALTAIPSTTITVTDTGTINDYSPTGFANASVVVFNGAGTLSITGLAGGTDGRRVILCDVSANSVSLVPESVSTASAAANRFNFVGGTAGNLGTLGAGNTACMELLYLGGTINRWTQVSLQANVSQTVPFTFASGLTMNGGAGIQGLTTLSGIPHIRTNTTTPPVLSTCGTGPTVVGTDTAMTVTTGTGATACTVTFGGSSWGSSHPACIVYPEGGAAFPAISYSTVTAFTLGTGTAASTKYDITCIGTN